MEYKYAVYPGTITMLDGTERYFSADELAELYGIEGKPYLVVPEIGPLPWGPDRDEVSYIHLKPQSDGVFVPVTENYKTDTTQTYPDIDFDNRTGGKWIEKAEGPLDDTEYNNT